MPHPLDSFFAPASIALIGASRDLEKIPGRLLSMLRKNEFPGKIYPINPNYGDIDGLKCYPSIADVGQPIDLAIVIIPARAVLGALEQCAAVGVKNAVIISSGFAEEGGDSAAMQDAIVTLAKKSAMRKAFTARSSASPPPSARPLMSSRARRHWSRPNGGSALSRKAAASVLRSITAPRRWAWRSATSSAPAMNPTSAPANSSTIWCRMPPPT
jgi:predicted CoA-binding protein